MSPQDTFAAEQAFLEAVAAEVTPAMQRHGYLVCSEGEGWSAGRADLRLRRSRSRWRLAVPGRPKRRVRHLAVGYEGEGGDELWLWFHPERQELDVSQWAHVLPADLSWRRASSGPVDSEQLRSRLQMLGRAIDEATTLADGS